MGISSPVRQRRMSHRADRLEDPAATSRRGTRNACAIRPAYGSPGFSSRSMSNASSSRTWDWCATTGSEAVGLVAPFASTVDVLAGEEILPVELEVDDRPVQVGELEGVRRVVGDHRRTTGEELLDVDVSVPVRLDVGGERSRAGTRRVRMRDERDAQTGALGELAAVAPMRAVRASSWRTATRRSRDVRRGRRPAASRLRRARGATSA